MSSRILLIAVVLAPLAADAQSYRCAGKDGKRYYGQVVPEECFGRPIEQLNAQGMVVGRIDPEGSEKEKQAKEAAEAKKREEETTQREKSRRNRALLATYNSEKDIDEARLRALAENAKAIKDVETRIADLRKQQAAFEKELDSHKGKSPPARLQDDIKLAEADLKAQQQLLETKKREVNSINAKYDEDKKRYAELSKRR
jgi:hypothetical protein